MQHIAHISRMRKKKCANGSLHLVTLMSIQTHIALFFPCNTKIETLKLFYMKQSLKWAVKLHKSTILQAFRRYNSLMWKTDLFSCHLLVIDVAPNWKMSGVWQWKSMGSKIINSFGVLQEVKHVCAIALKSPNIKVQVISTGPYPHLTARDMIPDL